MRAVVVCGHTVILGSRSSRSRSSVRAAPDGVELSASCGVPKFGYACKSACCLRGHGFGTPHQNGPEPLATKITRRRLPAVRHEIGPDDATYVRAGRVMREMQTTTSCLTIDSGGFDTCRFGSPSRSGGSLAGSSPGVGSFPLAGLSSSRRQQPAWAGQLWAPEGLVRDRNGIPGSQSRRAAEEGARRP
jgi:hypothetical protein